MKALIVDDEKPARRRLSRELLALGVEVVGEAEDGDDALAKLPRLMPDLLLLDVCMPGLDGIALAARRKGLPPIIFVTAHDEFAVRAFEVDAIDYLLKPVRRERLAAALARAERRVSQPSGPALEAASVADLAPPSPRIITFERGASRFFEARAIARFWSTEKYTAFRADGAEHLTPEPLSALAERLAGSGFRRVHRGELIHVARVRSLRGEGAGGVVELDDGSLARVSRRSLPGLREELAALGGVRLGASGSERG